MHRQVHEQRVPFLEALLDTRECRVHLVKRGVHEAERERAPVTRAGPGGLVHERKRLVSPARHRVGQRQGLTRSIHRSVGLDRPLSDRDRLLQLFVEEQGIDELDLDQQLPRVEGETPAA